MILRPEICLNVKRLEYGKRQVGITNAFNLFTSVIRTNYKNNGKIKFSTTRTNVFEDN